MDEIINREEKLKTEKMQQRIGEIDEQIKEIKIN